jgi:hypothetical protein
VCEDIRLDKQDLAYARQRLELVNLGCKEKGWAAPNAGPVLAIPADGPQLHRIFGDTDFHKGGWYEALKQAPKGVVLPAKKIKINGSTKHCQLLDLDAFEKFATGG